MHRIAMLKETKAVMDTATTSGWPVAKFIFGDVMSKIESGKLQWCDEYALWQARVDAKADVARGMKRENSPHKGGNGNHPYGATSNTQAKRQAQIYRVKMPCKNFNWSFCREHSDHNDPKLPQRYVHICQYCINRPGVKDKRHKVKHCTYQGQDQQQ